MEELGALAVLMLVLVLVLVLVLTTVVLAPGVEVAEVVKPEDVATEEVELATWPPVREKLGVS